MIIVIIIIIFFSSMTYPSFAFIRCCLLSYVEKKNKKAFQILSDFLGTEFGSSIYSIHKCDWHLADCKPKLFSSHDDFHLKSKACAAEVLCQ
mmetsp:Transcript_41292/g.67706  ORF Transcript_41292/g.67706 Transcript_41292/m.67706 type:complete len:92 (+) Transcript_41292:221-496(+)